MLGSVRLAPNIGSGSSPVPNVGWGGGQVRAGTPAITPAAVGTQAGKTTLLNCLAAAIPGGDRVVSAEEVFELRFPQAGLCNTPG